ncbi:hypothetical protein MtrunA17_Chr5g0409671 [Medicago truncatula]|uniref:Uncharacterized protein n=1 Tax=Medicago truncatula TaxID=3880 RepID=A0A396HVH2_MEDTR|nr:hypothetical protein MtrunA17_Chr5g0409671 [Medicago truncatula]
MLVMIKDERSANDPSSFAGLLLCLVVEEAIDSLVLFMEEAIDSLVLFMVMLVSDFNRSNERPRRWIEFLDQFGDRLISPNFGTILGWWSDFKDIYTLWSDFP